MWVLDEDSASCASMLDEDSACRAPGKHSVQADHGLFEAAVQAAEEAAGGA